MSNQYRALSPAAEAAFSAGVFEADYTATEEQDHLGSGLIELVPRTYKVLSNNFAAAAQGETFEATFLVDNEAALISGGHIERVDAAPELIGEARPELFVPTEPGAVVPAPKKKDKD